MQATELLHDLQALIQQHGDQPILVADPATALAKELARLEHRQAGGQPGQPAGVYVVAGEDVR